MKYKIFYKEFLGKKKTIILFSIALLLINITLAYSTHNLILQLETTQAPDALIYGEIQSGIFNYADISEEIDYVINYDKNNDFEIVPCKTVTCLTISNGPMKSAEIDIHAFKTDYLTKHIQPLLFEGRLPKKNDEIVVGNYFLNYFGLNIGDTIGKDVLYDKDQEYGFLPNIDIGNKELDYLNYKEFKIVGVLKNPTFRFSIIRTFEEEYQPNKMLLYFKNGNVSFEKFTRLISDISGDLPANNIGEQSVQYNKDKNVNLIISFIVQVVLFLIIALLIILYIAKGMKKKIGILKSLGIKDKRILNIVANNFLIFVIILDAIALLATNILFMFLNRSIDEFYGFNVNTYSFTANIFLVNIVFNILIYITIFVSIKIRTTISTPKESMIRG